MKEYSREALECYHLVKGGYEKLTGTNSDTRWEGRYEYRDNITFYSYDYRANYRCGKSSLWRNFYSIFEFFFSRGYDDYGADVDSTDRANPIISYPEYAQEYAINETEKMFYQFFHEACTDKFSENKLFSREVIPPGKIYSRKDVQHLMKAFSTSTTTSYAVIPESEDSMESRSGHIINWPLDITANEELEVLKRNNMMLVLVINSF